MRPPRATHVPGIQTEQLPRRWRDDRVRATGHSGWALLMPLIIIGGIRFGLTTDTEAAAVAVVYALAVSLLIYRELRIKDLPEMLKGVGRSSATILFLLAAAGPFSWLVAESQINHAILGIIRGISQNPVIILLIVNGFLLLVEVPGLS